MSMVIGREGGVHISKGCEFDPWSELIHFSPPFLPISMDIYSIDKGRQGKGKGKGEKRKHSSYQKII